MAPERSSHSEEHEADARSCDSEESSPSTPMAGLPREAPPPKRYRSQELRSTRAMLPKEHQHLEPVSAADTTHEHALGHVSTRLCCHPAMGSPPPARIPCDAASRSPAVVILHALRRHEGRLRWLECAGLTTEALSSPPLPREIRTFIENRSVFHRPSLP